MKSPLAILLLLLVGCSENPTSNSTSDTAYNDSDRGDSDTAPAEAYCADDEQINPEQCGAVCDMLDNQTDCENMVLPVPEHYFDAPLGHGCVWYTAVETTQSEDGSCTFGEEIHLCGYAFWDEDSCGGTDMPCGENDAWSADSGAAVTEKDGRTFMIRHTCPPQQTTLWTRCAWEQWVEDGPIFPGYKVPEVCSCACELDISG